MISPQRTAQPWFPKVRPHAPDTIQTPSWNSLSLLGKIDRSIWLIGKRLTERDTKFAIKAGMATAILASPAFIDSTRPTFVAYFGDWALISVSHIMSISKNAIERLFLLVLYRHLAYDRGCESYLRSSFRLSDICEFRPTISVYSASLGPCMSAFIIIVYIHIFVVRFGATIAVLLYTLFPEDPILLSLFGFCFSVPCFWWAIAKPRYLSASRFVLLTYNLTCLYWWVLLE